MREPLFNFSLNIYCTQLSALSRVLPLVDNIYLMRYILLISFADFQLNHHILYT